MSNEQSAPLVNSSVDYLTVTTNSDRQSAALLSELYRLLGTDFLKEETIKPWRFMGYIGKAAPGVRWGLRKEQGIVMLSGVRCSELWHEVAPHRNRCTRVDLSVTVMLENSDVGIAERAYAAGTGVRGASSSLVVNSKGGSTCYVGSRQSRYFGRLYDKSAESGQKPGKIWRYEVEIKKPSSETVVAELLGKKYPGEWMREYVRQWFTLRGVDCPVSPSDAYCAIEEELQVTSAERQLQWLSTQVRPTIGRLLINGYEAEVREALGLPEKTQLPLGL